MPYSIRKRNGRYAVVTTATGKVLGIHDKKAQAERQLRAIYANTPPSKEKK